MSFEADDSLRKQDTQVDEFDYLGEGCRSTASLEVINILLNWQIKHISIFKLSFDSTSERVTWLTVLIPVQNM